MIFAISLLGLNERKYCMGVPIILENELDEYTEVTSLDISMITFNEKPVAADYLSNSIFITQSAENLKNTYSLQGKIAIAPEYSLYFLNTPAMDDVSSAVCNGDSFTLVIKNGNSYQRVNVVITTLPVLYLDFESMNEDEQGNFINKGELTLWNYYAPSAETYGVTTSLAEWHIRGNSTRIYSKSAWKVNLRKEDGENNHLDLLGLGSDDDWILNPMSMDDTKLKEKIAQEIWNQLAADTSHNDKMVSGEYIEVLINGAYQGIYSRY